VRACVAGIEITRIWKTLRKCQDFLRQLPTAVSADLKRSLSLHQEAVRASLKAEVAAQVRPCRMLILICVPSHVCVRGRARGGRDLTHVRMRRRCGLVGNTLQFIGSLRVSILKKYAQVWENAGQQREAFEALGKLVDCLARDLEDKASRCVSACLRVHLMYVCVCLRMCVFV
jgi:hypothetical protein